MNYGQKERKEIKSDLWSVLEALSKEVGYLRQAITDGRIDGRIWVHFDSGCGSLVGILALAKGATNEDISVYDTDDGYWTVKSELLSAFTGVSANESRPIERFVRNIHQGDTPRTSAHSAQLLEWVDEWLAYQRTEAVLTEERLSEIQSNLERGYEWTRVGTNPCDYGLGVASGDVSILLEYVRAVRTTQRERLGL